MVTIDKDKCTGCGNCIIICGGEVFEVKEKNAIVAHSEGCLECGNFEVVCLADVIRFQIPKGGTDCLETEMEALK